MKIYQFKHLTRTCIIDENQKEVKEPHGESEPLPVNLLSKLLSQFKNENLFSEFHKQGIAQAIQSIKHATSRDQLIIQLSSHLEELDKALNTLSKRFREWFAYYSPEQEHLIRNHHELIQSFLTQPKDTYLQTHHITNSMGIDLLPQDLVTIHSFATLLDTMYAYQEKQDKSLERIMQEIVPNITALTGHRIGAKLISHSGSLRRLALLPASTIQLLGAEKALFRHIRTGARSPKHGLIIQHPLVANAKQKGRVARILADKIAIAARVDYFQGKYCGDQLRKEVEAKVRE
ncbi:MAG: hypothetical protein AABX52_00720 [Nanoarchaeota archaeon]